MGECSDCENKKIDPKWYLRENGEMPDICKRCSYGNNFIPSTEFKERNEKMWEGWEFDEYGRVIKKPKCYR